MVKTPTIEKGNIELPAERKRGTPIIIDAEDIRILLKVCMSSDTKDEGKDIPPEKWNGIKMTDLETAIGISRKSLLNHLEKLINFGWVVKKSIKENYKIKEVVSTGTGFDVIVKLMEWKILEKEGKSFYINTGQDMNEIK